MSGSRDGRNGIDGQHRQTTDRVTKDRRWTGRLKGWTYGRADRLKDKDRLKGWADTRAE